jgi:hypothetical protein
MYEYCLGYRFQGVRCGHEFVEGFKGVGFSSETACRNATRKAQNKCEAVGEAFDQSRIFVSEVGLTPAELRQVQDDWKIGG